MDVLNQLLIESDFFANYCEIDKTTDVGREELIGNVKKLYQFIFSQKQNNLNTFNINKIIVIEHPSKYKKMLIDACSLLTNTAKY